MYSFLCFSGVVEFTKLVIFINYVLINNHINLISRMEVKNVEIKENKLSKNYECFCKK